MPLRVAVPGIHVQVLQELEAFLMAVPGIHLQVLALTIGHTSGRLHVAQ